jgi:hypothetical protein
VAFAVTVVAAAATALLADGPAASHLVLDPERLAAGRDPWTPLTALFLFPEGRVGGVVLTALTQWLVGSGLERSMGPRRYALVVVGAGLLGYVAAGLAVLAGARGPALGGTGPLDLATFVLMGVVLGRQPLQLLGFLPMSARGLAGLAVAFMLLGPLSRLAPALEYVPLMVAAGVAWLLAATPWRNMRGSGKVKRRSSGSRRDHLRVVQPPDRTLHRRAAT